MPPRVRSCCYFSIFNKKNNQRNELITVINQSFLFMGLISPRILIVLEAHTVIILSVIC